MSDLYSSLLLFGVGIVSGFINVMAGGGSTLTLPALIFLGLDSSLANGTNRVAVIAQNVSSIYSFHSDKYSDFKLSFKLSLLTIPGAVAGAVLAVRISDELFQTILGIVMIGVIISMLIPNPKITQPNNDKKIPLIVYISMLFVGFYTGFIQAGVGFIIMAVLFYMMRMNLLIVNMHKVFIVLIGTLPALLIFIFTDNVDWILGFVLAAGNAIGGWWAAKLSVKKGEGFIRIFLIVTIFIMALKLLDVF